VKKAHTKVGFSFFKGLVISDLETSKRIVYGDVVMKWLRRLPRLSGLQIPKAAQA
jgi:hypothetical protein